MAIFTLTINTKDATYGDRPDQERSAVSGILARVAGQIGQTPAASGAFNGGTWAFGGGSQNAPVNPASGTSAGGTSVTIKGIGFSGVGVGGPSGLGAVSAVSFGGAAATSVVVVDDQTITCVTPAHSAGAVDVVIGSPGRQTLPGAYTFV